MPSYERRPSSRSDDERGSSRGTVKSESPLTVEVADEEEEDLAGMISNQPPSFHLSMSEMLPTTENCENWDGGDRTVQRQRRRTPGDGMRHNSPEAEAPNPREAGGDGGGGGEGG